MLVLDTAAGGDTLVQFQVAGAVLEDSSGATTDNVLAQVEVLTFDDPSGESGGLQLRDVPSGTYTAVRLLLTPGSGYSLAADGTTAPVQGPVELRIPIAGGLAHDARRASWLLIGHDRQPLSAVAGQLLWDPAMSARGDGEPVVLTRLTTPVATGGGITVSASMLGSALLFLEFDGSSEFEAEDGARYPDQGSFLADAVPDQQIQVDGELRRDGRVKVDRLRHCQGNDEPRLIGRIQSLDGEHQMFQLRVQATTHDGHHDILSEHEDVLVDASAAVIRRPNGDLLEWGDLAEEQLVKVTWSERSTDGDGHEVFVAADVEVPAEDSGEMHPQWRGRVDSVDLVAGTFVIVPYGDRPIVIDGVVVDEVTVVVTSDTTFEFDDHEGSSSGSGSPAGQSPAGLADLQPGIDRVWVRGTISDGDIVAERVWVQEHDD